MVRRLEALERDPAAPPAAAIVTTPQGLVLEVHAARLWRADGRGPVTVTLAPAGRVARAALRIAAHGLTPAQQGVAEQVLQGRSTKEIVAELHIGEHTVQDHLKAVFDKLGVSSRRELVAALAR